MDKIGSFLKRFCGHWNLKSIISLECDSIEVQNLAWSWSILTSLIELFCRNSSWLLANNHFHKNLMRCAVWYHSYNLKDVKNAHGGVLLLVKLQASDCNFTKCNTPPWVFFTFFKLGARYQIAQRTANTPLLLILWNSGWNTCFHDNVRN